MIRAEGRDPSAFFSLLYEIWASLSVVVEGMGVGLDWFSAGYAVISVCVCGGKAGGEEIPSGGYRGLLFLA